MPIWFLKKPTSIPLAFWFFTGHQDHLNLLITHPVPPPFIMLRDSGTMPLIFALPQVKRHNRTSKKTQKQRCLKETAPDIRLSPARCDEPDWIGMENR